MVEIELEYEGALHTMATHGPSKSVLATDAPKDNHGRGEAFSPTDLLATSLGACMLTVMGISARRDETDLAGTRAHVEKHMTVEAPRRVRRLVVAVVVPAEKGARISGERRRELEQIAENCPVRLSLNPAIEVATSYRWD
ncbi:MAG: OsmC family protein [Polyangiaceae bacterium]